MTNENDINHRSGEEDQGEEKDDKSLWKSTVRPQLYAWIKVIVLAIFFANLPDFYYSKFGLDRNEIYARRFHEKEFQRRFENFKVFWFEESNKLDENIQFFSDGFLKGMKEAKGRAWKRAFTDERDVILDRFCMVFCLLGFLGNALEKLWMPIAMDICCVVCVILKASLGMPWVELVVLCAVVGLQVYHTYPRRDGRLVMPWECGAPWCQPNPDG